MDEESEIKNTPPPTQHISFDDEGNSTNIITETPTPVGLASVPSNDLETEAILEKYNIKLKFKPNNPHRSGTIIFFAGLILSFIIFMSNSLACCGTFFLTCGIAIIADMSYYSEKQKWQEEHNISTTGTNIAWGFCITVGILLILFGIHAISYFSKL